MYPANDNLMELLVLIDACKRASAGRITAVIPYYGYGRQDRKSKSRTPITAKLVANMIETAGANRVLTMDLHAGQIQGFFDVPVDDLKSKPLFAKSLGKSPMMKTTAGNGVIVSPDAGGVPRARSLAKVLNCDIAIIDKRRDKANESEAMNVIGNVRGKQCIIVDDIVDTGGTLIKAAQALSREGAEIVEAYITHGVLSKNGAKKMESSALSALAITDSIPNEQNSVVKIISIAGMPELIYNARWSSYIGPTTLFWNSSYPKFAARDQISLIRNGACWYEKYSIGNEGSLSATISRQIAYNGWGWGITSQNIVEPIQ